MKKKAAITLPLSLTQRRVYILPTKHGYLFIIVLCSMLAGSINYNNNLGFLLTFLLGGMAFVSMIHTYRNLTGIRILSIKSSSVFAGEKAAFEIYTRPDSGRRESVLFQFETGEETKINIHPERDNRIKTLLQSTKRGILKPGRLTISTRYPLGLFRAWSKLDIDTHCIIYPKPLISPLTTSEDNREGENQGKPAGMGADDFMGLEYYKPGDSLKRIYWKAYSRGRELLVKDFVGYVGSSLLLDFNRLKDRDTERKLSKLCYMVLKADRSNILYKLNLPGNTIDMNRGDMHRLRCLKALALFGLSQDNA